MYTPFQKLNDRQVRDLLRIMAEHKHNPEDLVLILEGYITALASMEVLTPEEAAELLNYLIP